jgi:hypothetical protein
MKSLIKLAGAFALGIIITVTVIVPKLTPKSAETPPAPDIQSEIAQMADTSVETTTHEPQVTEQETSAVASAPQKTESIEIVASTEIKAVKTEPTTTPEPAKVGIKAEPKQPTSPQVTPAQSKTWWENGKQYTMINGHKAEISPEGNNQLSYYDWENDPLKDVPGPFNGNGN